MNNYNESTHNENSFQNLNKGTDKGDAGGRRLGYSAVYAI